MTGNRRLALTFVVLVLLMQPVAAQRERIFVPTPRGSGETLDPSPPPTADLGEAVVKTLQGDVIKGKVLGIGADGAVRLTGRPFSGEVKIRATSLDRITLKCTAAERGQDMVQLTNGDRIRGELTALTSEAAVINTDVAGVLKVPRRLIASISLGRGSDILFESNFASGGMEPWTVRTGNWSVTDGKLTCLSSGNNATVATKLDQKEAVTFVAKVKATGGNMQVWLMLFVDNPTGQFGRNGIYMGFAGSQIYLGYSQNGGSNQYTNRSIGRSVREGTIRFAYDPKTGKVRVWLDATDFGEFTPPIKPKAGKWVMYSSYYSSQTTKLTVLRGIVPPEDTGGAAEEEKDVVEFGNKDRVSASDITMADGKFTIKTSFGELTPQAGKVASIVFRKKDREEARRLKADVQVQTAGGRMTVTLKELTATHLLGASGCYGDVKLAREAVREIRFNLYR